MQSNVKQILTVANGLDAFEKVVDRPSIGKDDVPAFVILNRSKDPEAFNTSLSHYNGPWEYQCLIVDEMNKDSEGDHNSGGEDYESLEVLFTDFCAAMLGDGLWELAGLVDFGPYAISGRELLGVSFTLAKHEMDRF